MKLLQYTARYFGWFILLALPVTIGILFLTTRFIINQEQNELLEDNGMALTRQWNTNGLPADRVLLLANDLIEVKESALVPEKIFWILPFGMRMKTSTNPHENTFFLRVLVKKII